MRRTTLLLLLVLAAVAAALVFTGPATDTPDPAGPPSVSWPTPTHPEETVVAGDGTWADPASVDRTDPAAVGRAVATASAQWDTRVDATATAGIRRAAPLLHETVLAQQVEPARAPVTGGWTQAAEVGGYTQVQVTPAPHHQAEHAPPGVVAAVYRVSWDWQATTELTTLPGGSRTVYLELTDTPDGWTVTDYGYEDARPTTPRA